MSYLQLAREAAERRVPASPPGTPHKGTVCERSEGSSQTIILAYPQTGEPPATPGVRIVHVCASPRRHVGVWTFSEQERRFVCPVCWPWVVAA
jgi:hypothetical protein